jgi:hypothetical protein
MSEMTLVSKTRYRNTKPSSLKINQYTSQNVHANCTQPHFGLGTAADAARNSTATKTWVGMSVGLFSQPGSSQAKVRQLLLKKPAALQFHVHVLSLTKCAAPGPLLVSCSHCSDCHFLARSTTQHACCLFDRLARTQTEHGIHAQGTHLYSCTWPAGILILASTVNVLLLPPCTSEEHMLMTTAATTHNSSSRVQSWASGFAMCPLS